MSKFLFLFLLYFSELLFAQKQIHIKYLNVRSDIANVYEDLYTDGKNVSSKQDGNIMFTDPDFATNKRSVDLYFISKIANANGKDFFFTSKLDNIGEYFVHDKVPNILWSIDKKDKKKILGYECNKATAVFRGSNITAYFAKDIPYSVGPFKFFGLPGAILDVRVDGKSYDIWKAVKVDLNDKTKINYQPDFPEMKKMEMKNFVELRDNANSNFKGASVDGNSGKIISVRLTVEKIFEWEKETENK